MRVVEKTVSNILFPDALPSEACLSFSSTQNITHLSMIALWYREVRQSALETSGWNEEFCCLFIAPFKPASYEDPQVRTGVGLTVPPVDLSRLFIVRRQEL